MEKQLQYQQLERRIASSEVRLVAARKLQQARYQVWLRADPVMLYSTWEKDYTELVEKIFAHTG